MVSEPDVSAILLVDDRDANLLVLEGVLEPLGLRLVRARSGAEALQRADAEDLALILMDVQMPGLDGFETATLLRQRERSRDVPIIFVTAIHTSAEHVSRGYETGAVDYLSKPFDPDVLRAKVNAFVQFHRRGLALLREHGARQSAEAASRSKDAFLATVSHELRTPLNAILGWSETIRSGKLGPLPPRAQAAMETVVRAARAQGQLIEDLLDVSRIVSGKLAIKSKRCALGEVVAAAVDAVRPIAGAKRVTISVELAAERSELALCDPHRVQQVVWNLLANAVKFSPEGSSVTVSLARVGAELELRVADRGIGLSEAALQKVFEHLWQADSSSTRRQGGLGLGLAIVRRIVELHGGSIRAESAGEGQGATFVVRLPAVDEGSPSQALKGEGSGAITDEVKVVAVGDHRLDGLTLLVVDDDADSRELMSFLFTDAGAVVITAASSVEALQRAAGARLDLIISDLGMPDEDGFAFIRRVRAQPELAHVPAIALTGFSAAQDRHRALEAGFQTHVSKPFEVSALIALIDRLARR